MKHSFFGTAALSVVLASFAADARASDDLQGEIMGRLRYGADLSGHSGNPFGPGMGLRGGVELVRSVYIGVNAMHWFGTASHTYASQLGAEAGFGVHVSMITFRALLGYGFADTGGLQVSTVGIGGASNAAPTNPNNESLGMYLEPGIVVLATFGHLTFGADTTLIVLPGADGRVSESKALDELAVGLQAGLHL